MALASCALWAWSREKPVAAGVLIGLGTAAKLYPVFLLVPVDRAGDPHRPIPPGRVVHDRGGGDVAGGEPADRAGYYDGWRRSTRSARLAPPRPARSGP